MGRIFKLIGILALLVLGLLIGLAIFLKSILTPDLVRQKVLPVVSEQIGRPVTVGDIDIGLFSGITLRDVEIGAKVPEKATTPAERGALISAKEASLGYDLIPILSGRIVINHLILKGPELTVVRRPDGSLNISELLAGQESAGPGRQKEAQKGAGASPKKDGSQQTDGKGAKAAAGLKVLVSRISIEDGSITFIDMAAGRSGEPLRYVAKAIGVEISDLSLDHPFPVALDADIAGAGLKARGTVQLDPVQMDLKLSLEGLDAGLFSPYFQEGLAWHVKGPKISLDTAVTGDLRDLTLKGELRARGLDLLPKKGPKEGKDGAPIWLEGADAGLDFDITAGLEAGRVEIRQARVSFEDQPIDVEGSIILPAKSKGPVLDLQISGSGIEVSRLCGPLRGEDIERAITMYKPSGSFSVAASLFGQADRPARLIKRAEIDFKGVSVEYGKRPCALNGKVILQGARLSSKDLRLDLDGQPLLLSLSVLDLWARPVVLTADAEAERLDVTPFLEAEGLKGSAKSDEEAGGGRQRSGANRGKGAAKGAGPTADKTQGEVAADEPGPFDIPVDGSGSVKIGRLKYKEYVIDDYLLKWRLRNNKLTFDQNLIFAGGKIQKKGDVDLAVKGLSYRSDLRIQGVKVEEFLSYLSPSLRGLLAGELNLDGTFSGKGLSSYAIRRNLNAEGLWNMAKGVLRATGLMKGIASVLGLKDLDEFQFDTARGNFRVKNGAVLFRGAFSSKDLVLNPVGRIDLTGPISMDLNLKLSPQMTAKLNSTAKRLVVRSEDGWSQVPLKVSGTLSSPRVSLSSRFIKKRIGQEADRLLRGLFGLGGKEKGAK